MLYRNYKNELLISLFFSVLLISACTQVRVAPATGKQHSAASKKNSKYQYTVLGQTYRVLPSSEGYLEIGVASWYGKKFHGRLTANGETYDMYGLTAAHKSLPLPTRVKVTNLDNGRKIVLRVNDRGPFHDNRLIDLSYQAALKLGFANKGTAPVVVEALNENEFRRSGGIQGTGIQRTGIQSTGGIQGSGPRVTGSGSMSYYLQIGAFSRLKSAQHLMGKIDLLIGRHEIADVDVRILQSETGDRVLHKVWIGPIRDEYKRDLLASWVQEMKLGNPIRVDVD